MGWQLAVIDQFVDGPGQDVAGQPVAAHRQRHAQMGVEQIVDTDPLQIFPGWRRRGGATRLICSSASSCTAFFNRVSVVFFSSNCWYSRESRSAWAQLGGGGGSAAGGAVPSNWAMDLATMRAATNSSSGEAPLTTVRAINARSRCSKRSRTPSCMVEEADKGETPYELMAV